MQYKQKQILKKKNSELKNVLNHLYEISKAKDTYKEKAKVDALTGLLNKSTMQDLINMELTNPQLSISNAFIIVDLDYFKEANDTFGHDYGDIILKNFSNFLREIFRKEDYISRFGGDEFCIFLKNVPINIVEMKAKMIKKRIHTVSTKSNITASIGIAMVPANGNDYESIFKAADKALYYVKTNGKNNYRFAEY
jgi:diguanylate cyclase (GGDEF)-like protein